MSDLITSQMLSDWRANYGLDKRTPIKAMHWWQDNMDGKAPAGVVAALGLCINEIERLTAERDELRRQLAEAQRDSAMLDYVEQVFIDEGSGLELYPFGAVEDYADDGETVIGRKFLFGNAQGPTLRDAIYYAMGASNE